LKLFRRRPDARLYDLLEESGTNVMRTGGLLRDMLDGFPDGRADLAREILKCEQEGDRIAHDIIYRLHDGGVRPPVPRTELYALVSALDDIVDHAEETADSLGLYGVEAPMEQAEQLARVLAEASTAVHQAIGAFRLDEDLSPHLVEIHRLENEGDRLSRDAIASLFAQGVDPMVVIRWKDIVESLEEAIDSCETVAHVLEGAALDRR
jgi:predicted phosphate transport protein (TIGR00153 family)